MSIPLKVLLLEDDENDALLTVRALERAGYQPQWERVDREDEYLARLRPELDVVLADYNLPGYTARHALAALRASGLDVPLIIVSGAISEEMAVECMKDGAADYVFKDRMARLGQAVEQASEQRRLLAEKRRTEAALRDSERRFRALIEHGADAIVLFNPQGCVLYASPSAERVLGWPMEGMDGAALAHLVHPDDLGPVSALFTRAIDSPGESLPWAYRWAGPTGEWRSMEGTMTSLLDEPAVGAIVLNCRDVTERARAEEELRRVRVRLENLSRRLIDVEEGERRRLARELHDEVGQVLTGLKIILDMSGSDPTCEGCKKIASARGLVGDLIQTVRSLSRDLRPSVLDDHGLLPALNSMVDRFETQTGIGVAVESSLAADRRFEARAETGAYRIVQEALTNVARHAGVDAATVRVWLDDERLCVEVEDLGEGFDLRDVLSSDEAGGVLGMQERAGLLGGELEIDSAPGHGTRVRAELPASVPAGQQESG